MRGAVATRPPIRAVLWDIDGTLLDSEIWHQRATLEVCRRCGHDLTEAEYAATLGVAFTDIYARLDAVRPMGLSFTAWVDTITEMYFARLPEVERRPGGVELVDALAARGVIQACVSNSGREVVEVNLRHIGNPHLLFAISRNDVTKGKPDPEPYLLAARRLGLPPEACAVIEDSPTGARSGKAAGMLTVAWPQHDHLLFDAADHVVSDPADLDWDALCGLAIETLEERMAAD